MKIINHPVRLFQAAALFILLFSLTVFPAFAEPVYEWPGTWSRPYVKATEYGYEVGAAFRFSQAGDLLWDDNKCAYYVDGKASLLYDGITLQSGTLKAYAVSDETNDDFGYTFAANLKFSLAGNCARGVYTLRWSRYVDEYHGGPYTERAEITVEIDDDSEDVEINADTFPDQTFRNYVSSRFDTDGNGRLSRKETAPVTQLLIDEKKISSLKGIEYFTELTNLDCSHNRLKTLDISQNTNLAVLNCSNNKLTSLIVKGDIRFLSCWGNKFRKLDISNCSSLCYWVQNYQRTANSTSEYDCWKDDSYSDLWVDRTVTVIAGDTVSKPIAISISKAEIAAIEDQVYTGKSIMPAVTVTYEGSVLIKDSDYTVAYQSNKSIGTATVIITGKNSYTGTKKATFIINPAPVKILSLTAGKNKLKIKWKKGRSITGYEIEYSLKKNFSEAEPVTVSKAAKTNLLIRSLKKGKTYYVRVRTFKTVNGRHYFSAWSGTGKAKVK